MLFLIIGYAFLQFSYYFVIIFCLFSFLPPSALIICCYCIFPRVRLLTAHSVVTLATVTLETTASIPGSPLKPAVSESPSAASPSRAAKRMEQAAKTEVRVDMGLGENAGRGSGSGSCLVCAAQKPIEDHISKETGGLSKALGCCKP